MLHTLLLPLLLLCSCRALPYVGRAGPVEVRASSPGLARAVVRYVPQALATIRSLPDTRQHDHVEIRVWEAGTGRAVQGTQFENWIEVSVAPDAVRTGWYGLGLVIAHELAHHYLGKGWDVLPPLIEEGLVDVVACQAVPQEATPRRLSHASVLTSAIQRGNLQDALTSFALTQVEFSAVPTDRYEIRSALGWFIAGRIGVEGLKALADRARTLGLSTVPDVWFFQAARLDPARPESWPPEILSAAGLQITFR